VKVTAAGNDELAFRGGAALAWTLLDNIAAFQALRFAGKAFFNE
jgi:hypothetical protein